MNIAFVLTLTAIAILTFLYGSGYWPFPQLQKWYDSRRRSVDLQILWPVCKEKAPDLDHAKAAFAVHVFSDVAWTRYYSHDQIVDYISRLS